MEIDVAQLRKRVRAAIDSAKKDAGARRARTDEARQAYERFLDEVAVPAFKAMGNILRSEGLLFDVMTPSGGVRLTAERTREDGIELSLDTTVDPPRPALTTVRTRGSRSTRAERPVKEATAIALLTSDDVVHALLDELTPWLER